MGVAIPVYYVMMIIALLVVLLVAVLFFTTIKQKFLKFFKNLASVVVDMIRRFLP